MPVLALWTGVASQTTTLLPLWIGLWSVIAAILLTLVISIVQRDARRSALLAVLATLTFGTLGHLAPSGATLVHWLVLAATGLGAAHLTWHAPESTMRLITIFLNVVGIALLLANSLVIAANRPAGVPAPTTPVVNSDQAGPEGAQRDVWYLIPDRYPSSATLASLGIDNSTFEEALRERGFDVGIGVESNYPETVLSLASSWSLDLLDRTQPPSHAYRLLQANALGQAFRSAGYAYMHLGSWAEATADTIPATQTLTLQGASEFWTAWEATTAIPSLPGLGLGAPGAINQRRHIEHARHQVAVLDDLAHRSSPEPMLVMSHLLLPHEPYVFDRDGKPRTRAIPDRQRAYEDQLTYLNKILLDLVDVLQSRPDEPVILIMADEGPYPSDLSERMPRSDGFPELDDAQLDLKHSVFAALRDPDNEVGGLPRGTTSVNITRSLVAGLLGADLPPVPDHQFRWGDPARTSIVPLDR